MQTTASTPPKSRRRWYLLAGVALMLAVPVGYYFLAGWWNDRQLAALEQALDAGDPNWRWPDVLAEIKPVPDERNSALQIEKVRAMVPSNHPFFVGGKWEEFPGEYRNARMAKEYADPLRAAWEALPKGAIEEARKLKDMPQGHFAIPPDAEPATMELEHLSHTRSLFSILLWDAILRAHDGDYDGAAESCMALFNAAQATFDQPLLCAYLVRLGGQRIAMGGIERTLGQGSMSPATLAKVQEMLEVALDDGLHRAMRGQRAAMHQTYQNLRAGKTTLAEIYAARHIKPPFDERITKLFPNFALNGYPDGLRLMNAYVAASNLKDTERPAALAKVEVEWERKSKFVVAVLIDFDVSRIGNASRNAQARLRCMITLVAAERHRLEHGRWPGRPQELVNAKLLKEVHLDPYDGQPLRMKRTPTGIVVYAVGIDGVDDGGKLNDRAGFAPGGDVGIEFWDPNLRGVAPPAVKEQP